MNIEEAIKLDKIDIKILKALQANARISNADLAEAVNLSQTPCLRRLRKLEAQGLIKQYRTQLDRKQLGLQISAFVFVKLERNTAQNGKEFEQAVAELPQVMECCVLAGRHDYSLRIVTKDLESYERFIKHDLAHVDKVAHIESTIILNQVLDRAVIDLERSL
ncbi:Lrp/AsnC family transcriptional regulator [uncultured Pseudoteredinibacter sp.]|uniref:Lrp/AsnC family transcriptional regulator n=1 Tax=uncultured Pseudoteredinibacter sp. TaxID=1641701 RepID=UPI002622FFD8|nr:Lrp/AsnC family transcriptional regulator [uncultured Pseudoteredinibacter sp.]